MSNGGTSCEGFRLALKQWHGDWVSIPIKWPTFPPRLLPARAHGQMIERRSLRSMAELLVVLGAGLVAAVKSTRQRDSADSRVELHAQGKRVPALEQPPCRTALICKAPSANAYQRGTPDCSARHPSARHSNAVRP